MNKKRTFKTLFYHVFVILLGFIMIYPLLWMVMSSFKETNTIFRTVKSLIPETFTIENYINGWKGFGGVSFLVFFKNSMIITVLATVGSVFSSAIVGYGFARCKFKLGKPLFICMLLSMMLPYQIVMVPQYIMFQKMGWVGTFAPLIIPYFFGQGFFIFLIMQFVQGIPRELDESAKIDGCSYYSIFVKIILPLISPACVTSAIFSFMWRWDDFLGSLLYLNKPDHYTVSYALKLFSDPSSSSDYGAMFAMAVLSITPIVTIFILFQKYLVEGISMTGLKG
ncbi:carbohydrate ABC transporter permease [Lachnospiraceae bacterium 54-53]